MPGLEDQQVLQQLLTGMNTMQMQSGLMPGGIPAYSNRNAYAPPSTPTPAEFSNNLSVNLRNTFSYQPLPPPVFGGISPVARTDAASAMFSNVGNIGGGWGMARQQAQSGPGNFISSAQTTAGFSARTVFGGAIGLAATPFVGPWGGAAVGMGADFLLGDTVERMASMPFKPMLDQQQRAMQLQNMSLNNVRRGSGLSASGMGLSLTASMDLERNLMRTADNRNFKRDTHGMFNRQDMMKLTEISSQVGLLDSTQSVDQMSREMGKIGRALATFMKVVEEPDVRKALQMMGNMRNLGMSIPETNVAAANARTYARMAGTTVEGVMQAGMQGAGMFQQYGMSAATGLNVGMAATGTAGMLATVLDPRTLNMLGGREGMAQSLTSSAAQMSQISAILPGMLHRGKDGKLAVDEASIRNLMTGKGSIEQLVRASDARMVGPNAEKFITEYSTRKSELQDEFMNSLGGMGGTLLPLVMARRVIGSGVTKDMGAALRIAGLDEQTARTQQLLYESGTLGDTLRQQQRTFKIEQQRVTAQRREDLSDAAASVRWGRTGSDIGNALLDRSSTSPEFQSEARRRSGSPMKRLRNTFEEWGNAYDQFSRENFGEDTDIEEQRIAAGGGRVLRTLRPGQLFSETGQRQLADQLDTDAGARKFLTGWSKRAYIPKRDKRAEIEQWISQRDRMAYAFSPKDTTDSYSAIAERMFKGPTGQWGLTALGRGGENIAETAYANEGTGTALATSTLTQLLIPSMALRENAGQIDRRLEAQSRVGKDIELAMTSLGGTRLNEIAKTSKLTSTALAKVTAAAAVDVKAYVNTQSVRVGPWNYTRSGASGLDKNLDIAIDKALKDDPATASLTESERTKLKKSMRSEVIRSASEGMSSTDKDFLNKAAAGGADAAAQIAGGATQQTLLDDAETIRKTALAHLGIGTGLFDRMSGAAAVGEIFSTSGKVGELQQKFLVANALDAAAAAAGDTEQGKKLSLQAKQLRAETRQTKGVTEEQLTGAQAAANTASNAMFVGQRESMGKAFGREISGGKLEASLADARKQFQQVAMEKTYSAAAIGELGEEGAKVFLEGAQRGEGVAGLRKYYEGKGDTEAAAGLKGVTDVQMARRIGKRVTKDTEGVFSGGLGQVASKAQQATDDLLTQTVENLEEARRQDVAAQRNAASPEERFSMTVEDFAKATSEYAQGAKEFKEALETGHISHIADKSR